MDVDTSVLLKELQSRTNAPAEQLLLFIDLFEAREFRKHQHVYQSGDVPKHSVFVVKGCFRQYFVNEDGKEQIIYFAEENWWAGDLMSMRARSQTTMNLQALEPSEVLVMTRENWEHAFTTMPWFAEMHTSGHHRWTMKLQKQLGQMLTDDAETKYLRLLEERPTLLQRLPQYQIATYLGITPETLSRLRKKIVE